jgi:hypothetical protein
MRNGSGPRRGRAACHLGLPGRTDACDSRAGGELVMSEPWWPSTRRPLSSRRNYCRQDRQPLYEHALLDQIRRIDQDGAESVAQLPQAPPRPD